MKGFIFSFGLYFICCVADAQSFGKEGTTWQHCYFHILELPAPYELLTVTSVSSFKFKNLDCSTLYVSPNDHKRVSDTINVCRDGDRVFYQAGDSLFILYDFTLSKGDTLTVRFPIEFDTSFLIDRPQDNIYHSLVIDSVTMETIAGQYLIRQHITTLNENLLISFGRYITEKFGFEYWILPYFGYGALDGDGFAGLHSYQDQEILVDFDTPCLSTNVLAESKSYPKITIYPNPAGEKLMVESPDKMMIGLDVFSLLGQVELSLKNLSDYKIQVVTWGLAPGPYILKVHFNDGVKGQIVFVN